MEDFNKITQGRVPAQQTNPYRHILQSILILRSF
jgi:hypothetical protein